MNMLLYLSIIETPEDADKFEELYTQYRNLMYHVAYQILKNHYDAEDAVHQAFVAIIRNLDKITGVNSPETRSFVVLITERKSIDIIRTSHRKKQIPIDENLVGMDIPLPGDHGLADALSKLPSLYREVLMLRFDNGYSTKELANMLGLTHSGVRKLIGRAKKALERALEGDEDFEKPHI